MADEPHVLRGINWREAFPFTNIFRAFRIAIHPSKLMLALLALLVLYFGGRILDGVWFHEYRAVPAEIELYEHSINHVDFDDRRQAMRQGVVDAYAQELMKLNKPEPKFAELKKPDVARAAAEEGKHPRDVRYSILKEQDAKIRAVNDRYDAQNAGIEKGKNATEQERRAIAEAKKAAEVDRGREISATRAEFAHRLDLVKTV